MFRNVYKTEGSFLNHTQKIRNMEYVKFMYSKLIELMFKRDLKERIKIWFLLTLFFIGVVIISLILSLSPALLQLNKEITSVLSLLASLLIAPFTSIALIIFTKEYVIERKGISKFVKSFASALRRWFLKLLLVYALFYILLIIVGLGTLISNSLEMSIIIALIYYILGVWFWSIPYFIVINDWDKRPFEWFKYSLNLGKATFFKSLQISLFNLFILFGIPLISLILGAILPPLIPLLPLFILVYLFLVYPFTTLASLWSYIHLLKSSVKGELLFQKSE